MKNVISICFIIIIFFASIYSTCYEIILKIENSFQYLKRFYDHYINTT